MQGLSGTTVVCMFTHFEPCLLINLIAIGFAALFKQTGDLIYMECTSFPLINLSHTLTFALIYTPVSQLLLDFAPEPLGLAPRLIKMQ